MVIMIYSKMKKSFWIFAFFAFSLYQSQMLNRFNVGVGTEYRITPFNFNNSVEYTQDIEYNRDKQLSGLSFLVEMDYELFKNIRVGVAQSVRYDEKYYSVTEDKMIEGLIFDTHLDLKYSFIINNHNMFALLGYSFMNIATNYKETKVFQNDINGNPIATASIINDFSFNAYKFGLGYNYKNFNFILGSYYIAKEHNFSKFGTSAIGMPYLQINYNLFKF